MQEYVPMYKYMYENIYNNINIFIDNYSSLSINTINFDFASPITCYQNRQRGQTTH